MTLNVLDRTTIVPATMLFLLLVSGTPALPAHSDYGVLQSRNGGKTWQKVLDGTAVIDSLLADAKGNLIAATAGYLGGAGMKYGIYHSAAGAPKWTMSDLPAAGQGNVDIRSLLGASDCQVLAAGGMGVLRSSDFGATWMEVSEPLTGAVFQVLATGPRGTILAGASDGLYESRDGGRQWTKFALRNKAVSAIVLTSHGQLAVGTVQAGMYISSTSRSTWTPVTVFSRATVSAMAMDSFGRLYAGIFGQGVFKSVDDGRTWTRILSFGKNTATYALTVTPDGNILASAGICCPVNEVFLSRSPDGGKTWSRILRVTDGVAIGSIAAGRDGLISVGLSTVGD
jgi:photosystem II stability/assembly factor-like uncharacterized protein